jgi:hypothetical protein
MVRFYAVSCILKERNFAKFLKNFIFPGINPDRPYKTNIPAWEVDCYIKSNIDAVLRSFLRTVELIGKQRFYEQVKEEIKTVDDIASFSGPAERGAN